MVSERTGKIDRRGRGGSVLELYSLLRVITDRNLRRNTRRGCTRYCDWECQLAGRHHSENGEGIQAGSADQKLVGSSRPGNVDVLQSCCAGVVCAQILERTFGIIH